MKPCTAPANQSLPGAVIRIAGSSALRKAAFSCIRAILSKFFLLQYRAAMFPKRVRVSSVDHPLDKEIPFLPGWVTTYMDFTAFWIRCAGFLLARYGSRAVDLTKDFLDSITGIYFFAAQVYSKNFSTTDRPRYYRHPRFILIHVFDPHLMCIPSLHVMLMIRAYTAFRAALRSLGGEARFAAQIEECRLWALDITEAILYVKQHSVNCVSAAMYAMTCFDPPLFPPEEAEAFASALFSRPGSPPAGERVRGHIITLYRRFLEEGNTAKDWTDPLLAFLASCPRKGA